MGLVEVQSRVVEAMSVEQARARQVLRIWIGWDEWYELAREMDLPLNPNEVKGAAMFGKPLLVRGYSGIEVEAVEA